MSHKLEPYEMLANAIVEMAARDYIREYKKYLRRPVLGYSEELVELEEFFHSNWYETLTNVNGNRLLEMMKKRAEDEVNGKSSKKERL